MTRDRLSVALFCLALAPRLLCAGVLGNIFHLPDEGVYVDTARSLLAGAGYGAYAREPAYPAFLALLLAPFPFPIVLARAAQAVVASTGVLLTLGLGRRVFGEGPAVVAAVIYALDPLLVVAAGLLYPEALAAVLLLAALLAVGRSRDDEHLGGAALVGLLLGVLTLLRPVAGAMVPAFVLWTVAGSGGARWRARRGLAICGVYVLILVPWSYRNYAIRGELTLSVSGKQNAFVLSSEERASGGVVISLLRKSSREPAAVARHVAREFRSFWELYPTRLTTDIPHLRSRFHEFDPRFPIAPTFPRGLRDLASALSFGPELLLAFVGVAVACWQRRTQAAFIGAVILSYALGYAFFIAKLRYRIAVLPEVFLFAGVGATAIVTSLGWRPSWVIRPSPSGGGPR